MRFITRTILFYDTKKAFQNQYENQVKNGGFYKSFITGHKYFTESVLILAFLIYIMIESPNVPELKENISGGTIAAPVFARILENIVPILNVVPYIERIE